MDDINWFAVAVAKLGGVDRAAEALGVAPSALLRWNAGELRHAPFRHVVKLSRLSNVSLAELSRTATSHSP